MAHFSAGLARPPAATQVSVGLEPVYHLLTIIGLIGSTQENPGVHPWIAGVERQMPPERLWQQRILFQALGTEPIANLLPPGPATASLPAFIEALADLDPVRLRDHLVGGLLHSTHIRLVTDAPPLPPADPAHLLASFDHYRAYVDARFDLAADAEEKEIPPPDLDALLHAVYALLTDPPALQSALVEHLHWLWETHIAAEWVRVEPGLRRTVSTLAAIDLTGLTPLDAIQVVTGRNLRGLFDAAVLAEFPQVRLIPSVHTGPFVAWGGDATTVRLLFTARVPAETPTGDTAIDNAALLNSLNSLGDSTRLDILLAIKAAGELSTQAVINRFDLDKSAASRHLRNLRASGLLVERRDRETRTKFYRVDRSAVDDLLRAMAALLG